MEYGFFHHRINKANFHRSHKSGMQWKPPHPSETRTALQRAVCDNERVAVSDAMMKPSVDGGNLVLQA